MCIYKHTYTCVAVVADSCCTHVCTHTHVHSLLSLEYTARLPTANTCISNSGHLSGRLEMPPSQHTPKRNPQPMSVGSWYSDNSAPSSLSEKILMHEFYTGFQSFPSRIKIW